MIRTESKWHWFTLYKHAYTWQTSLTILFTVYLNTVLLYGYILQIIPYSLYRNFSISIVAKAFIFKDKVITINLKFELLISFKGHNYKVQNEKSFLILISSIALISSWVDGNDVSEWLKTILSFRSLFV